MQIYCRHELTSSPLDERPPAVLLEGSWPAAQRSVLRSSLDEALDARFQWIDADASRLAEEAAESALIEQSASIVLGVSPAWLNTLALRYYLVKLLRVVIYFSEVQPLAPGDYVWVAARRNRDEDYAELLGELCRLSGATCQVHWTDQSPLPVEVLPPDEFWRRWVDRIRRWSEPRPTAADLRRRMVFCGNPRFLEPVCGEAIARGCAAWWLYDRLALKAWWRWRRQGVGQLVCNSGQGRQNRLCYRPIVPCQYRGVDLGGILAGWMQRRIQVHGPRHTRLLEQIDCHFDHVRPHALVLDEDATPTARAAVAVARRHGVPSFVVQHGAPACRFGFVPLAADRLLAWGPATQRQLERWGVPPERILITGSPLHEEMFQRLSGGQAARPAVTPASRSPRILLLATVPPRDERPDAVALHLTGATYADMLRAAFEAVSRLNGVELIVKLHPRSPEDPAVRQAQSNFPQVKAQIVHLEPLEHWLGQVDCVLSCLSSAGIDATLAGLPVIQLVPAGCGDVLPPGDWGMLGSARTADELERLLARALTQGRLIPVQPNPNAFARGGAPAAVNIVQAILAFREKLDPAGCSESGIRNSEFGGCASRIHSEFRIPNSELVKP